MKKGVPADQAKIICCSTTSTGATTIISFGTDPSAREGFGRSRPASGRQVRRHRCPACGHRHNTIAFLVKPIQGEAGISIPPPGYLKRRGCAERSCCSSPTKSSRAGPYRQDLRLRAQVCARHLHPGQSPRRRHHAHLRGCLARDILGVFTPGSHGSTFGGNPLACASRGKSFRSCVRTSTVQHPRSWRLPGRAASRP